MKLKTLISTFLFYLTVGSSAFATTYNFTPEDLIFKTNVFTYNNQFLGENGVNLRSLVEV